MTDTTTPPNYYHQARERLEKAGVDADTICDVLELMDLQYRLGLKDGSNIVKEVHQVNK